MLRRWFLNRKSEKQKFISTIELESEECRQYVENTRSLEISKHPDGEEGFVRI